MTRQELDDIGRILQALDAEMDYVEMEAACWHNGAERISLYDTFRRVVKWHKTQLAQLQVADEFPTLGQGENDDE